MKKLIEQIIKFAWVGLIAFAIDYGLMIILTEFAHIDYLISATISFIVSVIFNYLASMRFVFTHKATLTRRREFEIFVILSVIGLFLNDYFMWMGTGFIDLDYRITKIGATFLVSIWNFISRKVFLDAGNETQLAKESLEEDAEKLRAVEERIEEKAADEVKGRRRKGRGGASRGEGAGEAQPKGADTDAPDGGGA